MRVAVIGPGAIGCLFACRLENAGIHVTLVDYREDRAARLSNTGIIVSSSSGEIKAKPTVVSHVPEDVDLFVIATKSYNINDLSIPKGIPVLVLQNGLGNTETICSKVGTSNVLAGSTSEAAVLLEEGRVSHTATGRTVLGPWTSCEWASAQRALERAGFSVEYTRAPGQAVWEKAAINAGINPLTALLNVPNGRLIEIPEVRQLMRDLVVEAVKVATTEGYRFPYSLVEKAEEVCKQTAQNTSSMLQDLRRGRQTEIDAISGEIIRRGQLAHLPTPRTHVVWQLVKGLEKNETVGRQIKEPV